jgi:3-mercaptopyruvate sulfurtransferase SseA
MSRTHCVTGIILTLAALTLAAGCANKASDKSLQFVKVDEAQRLAAGERSLLGGNKFAAYVDARTDADFQAGHIPGALSLPFERVSRDSYLLNDYGVLIVYGADYNDARANGMSKRLRELLKDRDIRTLDGGVRAWTAAGNELEKNGP